MAYSKAKAQLSKLNPPLINDLHWASINTAYMMVACIQRAVRERVCDTNSVHGHRQHYIPPSLFKNCPPRCGTRSRNVSACGDRRRAAGSSTWLHIFRLHLSGPWRQYRAPAVSMPVSKSPAYFCFSDAPSPYICTTPANTKDTYRHIRTNLRTHHRGH